MNFTTFTTEELQKMLTDRKEHLAHMVLMSGLSAEIETIEAIKEELDKRKDEQKTE